VPEVTLDGKSLAAVIKDAKAESPHAVLHWQIGKSWAVREGDWKLMFDVEDTTERSPGKVIHGEFLVNLRDDPSEKTNLASGRPEIVARLTRLRALWEAGR
jgi:arylsulfatase A